ncbi:MAG: PDZ domain-containing protein [Chloroflexi bacterium]|nr:PDZ domain-containing protein [Chloroflexota bacterium]
MQGLFKLVAMTLLGILIAAFSFLSGFLYSTVTSGPLPTSANLSPIPNVTRTVSAPSEFAVFWEAWQIIHKDFYGQIPDNKALTYSAIRGVVKSLNDQHTVFVEPSATARESEQLRGDFEGIGATVNLQNDQVVIVAPIVGSPAEQAGVQPGDIILKVDTQDVKGMSLDDVVALIRGPRGTKVTLTLLRLGRPDPIVIDITRNTIQLPSVISRMEQDNIGYVRLTIFGQKSKDEVATAIQDLTKKGAKALIFDLRSNPGGYLQSAIDVASQFIQNGVVAYERGKDGKDQEFRATGNGVWTNLPLAVLIDKGSASASEIVAGAIQDRKRAPLVGDTSYGKGSVQSVHQLSDQSSIHVTIAEWLTPNKTQITGRGLTPDIAVPISPEDQKRANDTQLIAALDYLKGQLP